MIIYQDFETGTEGESIPADLPPFSTRVAQDNAYGVYTSESIHGDLSARYDGSVSWSFHRITLTQGDHHRVRAYVRRDSDPTGHVVVMAARDADDDDLAIVRVLDDSYDHVIRHTRSSDFAGLGDTDPFPASTVWRLEYEIADTTDDEGARTSDVTLRVWTDPESAGEPDHTLAGTVDAEVEFIALGNLTGNDLDVVWDSIALSDGESIGPVAGDPVQGFGAAEVTLAAAGTGTATRTGIGTGGLTLAAASTGVATRSGTGTSGLTLVASGHGRRSLVDITVDVGTTRLRERVTVGSTRLAWTVGGTRRGWTIGPTRKNRSE